MLTQLLTLTTTHKFPSLDPVDVLVDQDLTAGVAQFAPGLRPKGQNSNLEMKGLVLRVFQLYFQVALNFIVIY